MPTWLKVLLLIFGAIVVIGVVAVYGAVRWFEKNQGRIKEMAERTRVEGRAFGEKTDPDGCIAEARRRLGDKPDLMGRITQRAFLRWCLASASRPPGFCDGVPKPGDFVKSAKWNNSECERRKYGDDQFCAGVVQEIQQSCWGQR
jgi:hypothetical protein